MTYTFQKYPAHTVLPGTVVQRDGVVFSSVFRNCASCGLILYHLPDLEEIRIPFTDEYRYGSLYSVLIKDLQPKEWAYRYYRDDYTFEDPYARELIEIDTKEGRRTACCLFPTPEDELPAYGARPRRSWADEVIYCLHVKGFTASKSCKTQHHGTFEALRSKIPYLKKLGVTAVELLPIYELRPESLDLVVGAPKDMAMDPSKYHIVESGEPKRNTQADRKPNYWNFGEGCYFAPKKAYSVGDGSFGKPQVEFSRLVQSFHDNGMEVILQLFFPDNVTIQTQLETARFYVTHYHIDGFHLKGSSKALNTLASDPMLSDTSIFYYGFPYDELQKEDEENPTIGKPSVEHLCEYNDNFQWQIRQFVKSDNNIIREFMKNFIDVPDGHGRVHYVTNYEGFTLNDLVSYNWKNNAANGEDNRDGNDNNYSWNCGVEGKSQKKDIRALRKQQMKNFLVLNFLAQGTPLLYAGDERCNSQNGNNNPYCQDNEIGWMSWKDTVDSREILSFTQKISAFRKEHAVFRRRTPFKYSDYKVIGYPDVSFHGKEAWKPELDGYSHTVGVLLPEQYAEENPSDSILYLAINMHWHNQMLGIPSLPQGWRWRKILDTSEEESFIANPKLIAEPRNVHVRGRSIQILQAVKEFDPKPAQPKTKTAKKAAPDKQTENESHDHAEERTDTHHLGQDRQPF